MKERRVERRERPWRLTRHIFFWYSSKPFYKMSMQKEGTKIQATQSSMIVSGIQLVDFPPTLSTTNPEDLYFQWLQEEERETVSHTVGGLSIASLCHRKTMTPP